MNDDANPKEKDRKADLERHLVERATTPYRKLLGPTEAEGVEFFLDLLVSTHPAMQRMIDRRLAEDAAAEAAKAGSKTSSAPVERMPDHSTIVSKGRVEDGTHDVEASGVVAKDNARSSAGRRNTGGGT